MNNNGSISQQAFRFLDIRAPYPAPDDGGQYVITRERLPFAATDYEDMLNAMPPERPDLHAASLTKLSAEIIAKYNNMPPRGGYIESANKYLRILAKGDKTPERTHKELKALLAEDQGKSRMVDYLDSKAAAVWDFYLARVTSRILGENIDQKEYLELVNALRAAALIARITKEESPDHADLSPLLLAGISIPEKTFNISNLRKRPESTPPQDPTPRTLQDELVVSLVRFDLAATELRDLFFARSALLAAPAVLAEVAPAAPGNETLQQGQTEDLLVAVKSDTISSSTKDLLLHNFGAREQADEIAGINIVEVLERLDHLIESTGERLFTNASQAAIAQFAKQASYLEYELRENGKIGDERLKSITLALAESDLPIEKLTKFNRGAAVNPLGVGDLKVVKQNLLRYEGAEVAHIENILQGQEKERIHSVKQKTEETFIVEQEKSTSSERDLQTTDRFEIAEESSSSLSEKRQNEMGVTVTASYGAVSISANTKFSDVASSEQSNKISRNFAREIVDRSVEKVQQRVREERVRKTTLEIEETNRYLLKAEGRSVTGIYRWIDKVYWAQVHVYGKRLMLEFMVPEPAALYLANQTKASVSSAGISPPEPLAINSSHIRRSNYAALAAKYGAEVESPPPSIKLAIIAGRSHSDTSATNISVPDGYVGISAGAAYIGYSYPGSSIVIMVGTNQWLSTERPWYYQSLLEPASGSIPVAVNHKGFVSYSVSAVVVCVPTKFTKDQWRLNTFKAIQQAYQLRLSEYEEAISRQQQGNTPSLEKPDQEARDIERRELQRSCIEILSRQHFEHMGAINENPNTGWPEIDYTALEAQGEYALFFQHGFEWEQMTYVFYPYFWARQSEWPAKLAAAGGDLLFSRFLMAGYARVIIPVRPAHESDVLYFLETGTTWGGTEPPVLGDPRFVSIIDEIKESLDAPDQGVPEGSPWQFKVPTSLIMLDDSGDLPEWPRPVPPPPVFVPSEETCNGVPYNLAQWPDAEHIADAIRLLGYIIPAEGDQEEALSRSRPLIRMMQRRFNELGVSAVIGRNLTVDGLVGPCTLRALTYFDGLRTEEKWPGVG